MNDRSTIYIKRIPDYYNTIELLSKFYKKFGSIEDIHIELPKHSASVKFHKPLDAVKAFNQNKCLFSNSIKAFLKFNYLINNRQARNIHFFESKRVASYKSRNPKKRRQRVIREIGDHILSVYF